MSKSTPFVVAILALALTFTLSAFAFAQGNDPALIEYIVTADSANLRSGPGTTHSVAGAVVKGDSLLIYDETPEANGWLRVHRPDDEDAYIADFLVERAPTRFYSVAQEPVLVASGRGSNITDIYELPAGAYRIDATVQDNAFILEIVTVEGDCNDGILFNELNFDLRSLTMSSLYVSRGCEIIFQTDNVDGEWEFEVRDLLDMEVLAETLLDVENGTIINGTGRVLTMPTFLEEGIWQISAVVDDQAFILRSQVLDGDCDEGAVFNELDFDAQQLEISSVYRSTAGGCIVFWDVSNVDSNWELSFEKLR